MEKTPEKNWGGRLKVLFRKWEFWLTFLGVAFSALVIAVIVLKWTGLRGLTSYGYLGAFIISIFGGATILAPIPMTPVVFALGSVMKPSFAPSLGPLFVGISAGMGETIGGIIIYATGYSGGKAILTRRNAKLEAAYAHVIRWMEKRGSLILFVLSAVINPFFYPAAITAGVMRFGLRRFILITCIGKTIKGISVASAGYWGLGSLLRILGVNI